jgi:hypothetical protein
MSIKTIPLKSIKAAGWNPTSRTSDVSPLAASIQRVGLLCPILVTKNNEIVDGHRRVAAAAKLGWSEIPAIVAEGDHAEMFVEVNGQKKPLSGNETLQVYLKEPKAVSARVRGSIEELEDIAGRQMLVRMAKENFTLGTWHAAKAIARASDSEGEKVLVKILRWLMKYRCARNATRALNSGTAPSKIMAAINNDKPIRISYVSA